MSRWGRNRALRHSLRYTTTEKGEQAEGENGAAIIHGADRELCMGACKNVHEIACCIPQHLLIDEGNFRAWQLPSAMKVLETSTLGSPTLPILPQYVLKETTPAGALSELLEIYVVWNAATYSMNEHCFSSCVCLTVIGKCTTTTDLLPLTSYLANINQWHSMGKLVL